MRQLSALFLASLAGLSLPMLPGQAVTATAVPPVSSPAQPLHTALAKPVISVKPKPVYPLEVDLIHGLNAAKLHVGDEVVTRLRQDWTDNVCILARKSVIRGTVVKADELDGKHTSISVRFEYGCAEAPSQRLTWLALLAPEQIAVLDTHGNPVRNQSFRSSSFGEGDPSKPSGVKSGDMSGRQNPSLPLFIDNRTDPGMQRPTAVKTGEVWHLPRLTLAVGTGPERSTVLSTTEKQVKVPGSSVLVLLPERYALQSPAPKAPIAPGPQKASAALPERPR